MPEPREFPTNADLRAFSRRVKDDAGRLKSRHDATLEANRGQLELERDRYHQLFDFAPDAYLVTDLAGSIVEANVAAVQLLAGPNGSVNGNPILRYFDESGKTAYSQQLDRLCGVDRIDDWQTTLIARNRTALPVAVSLGRVTGKDGKAVGYRWLLRDISKRKEAEDALLSVNRQLERRVASRTRELAAANRAKEELLLSERRAREEAEIANRVKSDFLSLLSHEFRTPLQAIFGYTEVLEREIHGPLSDAQKRDLERIRQSQQHLLTLINSILEFARLESGKSVDVQMEPVLINEALRTIDALIGPTIEARGLVYEYKCADTTIMAHADTAKVKQIVLNLVANAVKFTEIGGRITLSCALAPKSVDICVSDTGRGIPPDKLEAIFEPFVQLRSLAIPRIEGTGLGLPISRRLAEAMGASVTVASEIGVGSTFTLKLQRTDRA